MRDCSVSITKGIAILLMVLVHSRFSIYGDHFINMFHMPLFFFFSGYFFKSSNIFFVKNYLVKKIKGIYLPFVKWSIFFLLLHNVLYHINIYNEYYGFRGITSQLYDLHDYLVKIIYILFAMKENEQLLGGYWFLHSLFFGSLIFIILFKYIRKIYIVAVILLLSSVICCMFNLRVPFFDIGVKEFLASFFICAGYLYKKNNIVIKRPIVFIVCSIVMLIIGTEYWQCGMLSLTLKKIIPYALTALLGTISLFLLCKFFINKSLNKSLLYFFTYVGEHTLTILTWHFISFKLVSLMIIYIYDLPLEKLAEFPVIEEYSYEGWWLVYFVVGGFLPLALSRFSEFFFKKNIF